MNPFVPNYIVYLSLLLVTVYMILLVGYVILRFFPLGMKTSNSHETIFISMIVGQCALIPIFSIFWTKGNSIMWLSLFIWLILYVRYKKQLVKENDLSAISFANHIYLFIISIIIFSILFYLFFIRSGGHIYDDLIFYSNLSSSIYNYHIETTAIFPEINKATMYHYGSSWMTVLCLWLCHLKVSYVYLLVINSFYFILVLIASYSVVKHIHPQMNMFASVIFSLLPLFVVPIFSVFIHAGHPLCMNPKYMEIYPFLCAFLIIWLNKEFDLALIFLLFVVPFYSTISPGILSFVFIMAIVIHHQNKFKISSIFNMTSFLALILGIAYLLFYYIQPSGTISQGENERNIVSIYGHNIWFGSLLFFAKSIAKCLIILLPTLLCIYIYEKRKKTYLYSKLLLILIISCAVSAVVASLARELMRDGGQIMTNYLYCVYSISPFVVWLYVLKNEKFKKILNSFAIIVVIFYFLLSVKIGSWNFYVQQPHNEKVLKEYKMLFNKIDSSCIFGYVRNYQYNGNYNSFYTCSQLFYPLSSLFFYTSKPYTPYCLSAFDIPDETSMIFNDKKKSALYRYREEELKKKVYVSDEKSILNFVKSKGISHIVVEEGAFLPNILTPYSKKIGICDNNVVYNVIF